MAVVFIPSLMRPLAGGQSSVSVPGATLRQVIDNLEAAHPGFKARLLNEEGQISPTFSVIVDSMNVRKGLMHPIGEESEIHFLPRIGGGSSARVRAARKALDSRPDRLP